jgi:hypothetical protein
VPGSQRQEDVCAPIESVDRLRHEDGGVTDVIFRVVVRRDLDQAALGALARIGASYISGHSGPGFTSSSILVRADSEEAARREIEAALGEHAFISEARAMPVFVYAPVLPEARLAFELAAGEDERVGGVTEDEMTGELAAYFELARRRPGGGRAGSGRTSRRMPSGHDFIVRASRMGDRRDGDESTMEGQRGGRTSG